MTSQLLGVGLYAWGEPLLAPTKAPWLGCQYMKVVGIGAGQAFTDAQMTYFANNNIEVMALCGTATPDASYSTSTNSTFISNQLSYIGTLLSSYGPGGSFWSANPSIPYKPIAQVIPWQEYNFYWPNATGSSRVPAADLYAQFLIAAYNYVKASWPTVKVVGFGLGCASHQGPGILQAVMADLQTRGQVQAFDVLGIDMYSYNIKPEFTITESWGSWSVASDVQSFRSTLNSYGLNTVPIWTTETGYAIAQANGGRFADPTSGSGPGLTTAQQAAYTVRMNMLMARLGVERTYHMFFDDSDNYNGGWFDILNSYAARPVATTMRQFIQLTNGATKIEVVADGNDAVAPFIYRVTTPLGTVMAAWSDIPMTFTIPLDARTTTTVTDLAGNSVATVNSGSYSASLTEAPIFLASTRATSSGGNTSHRVFRGRM